MVGTRDPYVVRSATDKERRRDVIICKQPLHCLCRNSCSDTALAVYVDVKCTLLCRNHIQSVPVEVCYVV